jgi:cytochrome c biogenesis protein CcmG, thiol:disulfide interchange protein DsbE
VGKWICFVLLPLALVSGCDRGDHPRNIGKAAPEFKLVDGQQDLDLKAYRGKVVVLNFWATWCAPCVEEIPSLNQLQRDMPQLAIVGVSIDQNANAYRQFLAEHRIDFTTIRDPDRRISTLYGTQQFPESYVIDRDGHVRRKFISAQDWTSPEIVSYLSHL